MRDGDASRPLPLPLYPVSTFKETGKRLFGDSGAFSYDCILVGCRGQGGHQVWLERQDESIHQRRRSTVNPISDWMPQRLKIEASGSIRATSQVRIERLAGCSWTGRASKPGSLAARGPRDERPKQKIDAGRRPGGDGRRAQSRQV